MSMRPNIKVFPDDDKETCRTDRFSSEMTVHHTLQEARAAVAERQANRAKARAERRQRLQTREG